MLRCKESRISPLEMATAIGVNPARVENYLYNHELYSKDKRNKKLKIQTINSTPKSPVHKPQTNSKKSKNESNSKEDDSLKLEENRLALYGDIRQLSGLFEPLYELFQRDDQETIIKLCGGYRQMHSIAVTLDRKVTLFKRAVISQLLNEDLEQRVYFARKYLATVSEIKS